MWSVRPPETGVRASVELCVAGMQNADLKARLVAFLDQFEAASDVYHHAATNGALRELQPGELETEPLTRRELIWLYRRRFSAKGSPGRRIYDELLMAPINDVCPYCGDRQVAALDHLLPKDYLPIFAVDPINLVAICTDCNTEKREDANGRSTRSTLHPYFESAEATAWLFASLALEEGRPEFVYEARPPEVWPHEFRDRLKNHFSTLKLGQYYGKRAAQHFSGIVHRTSELFAEGGRQELWAYLDGEERTWRRRDKNGWLAAFYAALAASEWMLDGSFRRSDLFS